MSYAQKEIEDYENAKRGLRKGILATFLVVLFSPIWLPVLGILALWELLRK